ncbi:MAG: leucine-rich repeat protein, partial [archaeon]|nr:leucine-rich repeat protein [archaeon]
MASSSLLGSSPKALLKLPGVEKRPEASGRCLITGGKIVTSLDSKQVLQLLGKGKYPVNIDLCEAHFQIETDEFLRHIKDVLASLDLSSNCLKQLTSLNRFSKLKRLVVENNLLTTIEVAGLVSLEYLSLEGNQLVSLFNLVDLKKLVHLNLANNKICTGWHNLLSHKALKVLDLSNNSIDLTSKQFEADAFPGLRNLSALSYLALEGNPTAKKVPQFRAFVIHSFPKLKFLDWQAVSKQEQKAAETLSSAAPWHVEAVSVRKTVNRISRPIPEADLPHHHISSASASGSLSGDDSNNQAATDPSSSPVPAAAPPLASPASQPPTASTSTDPLEAFLSGDDSALYSFIAQPSAPSSGQPVKTETASESLDQLLGSLERPSSPAVAAPTPSPAAIAAVSPPRAAPAAAAAQRPVSSMESTQKSLDELLGSLESINAPQPPPAPVAAVVAPTNAQESLDSLLGSLESMTSAPVAAPPPAAKPAQLKRTNT